MKVIYQNNDEEGKEDNEEEWKEECWRDEIRD